MTTARWNNTSFLKELGGAMLLYAAVLVASLTWGLKLEQGPLQTAVFLSPVLPLALALWATVRQVRRSDEFIRKSTLEYIAIAAAVTAGWTFTYGFLENAGYPKLSMFTVWPVMGTVWALLSVAGHWRNR